MKTTITLLFIFFQSPGVEQEFVVQTFTSQEAEQAWDECERAREEYSPLISLPTHKWELECLEGRWNIIGD